MVDRYKYPYNQLIIRGDYADFIQSMHYDIYADEKKLQLDLHVDVAWVDENYIFPKSSVFYGSDYDEKYIQDFKETSSYHFDMQGMRVLRDDGRLLFMTVPGKHG